jgi:hypothetical protein
MIYIGEFDHPKVGQRKVEMSDKEAFDEAVRKISVAAKLVGVKDPKSLWKFRTIGTLSNAQVKRNQQQARSAA